MLTGIVMFVLGYLTHKNKDFLYTKIIFLKEKIEDFFDSKR